MRYTQFWMGVLSFFGVIILKNEITMKFLANTTLIILFFSAFNLNAQIKFGFKAGYTHFLTQTETSFASADGRNTTHEIDFIEMSPAKSLGLFTQSKLGNLFIQSEALYTGYTASYTSRSYINDDIDGMIFTEQYQNLDLNIIAGINVKNWRIGLGPKFIATIDFDTNLDQLDFYREKRKSLNQGFQGVLGYDYKNFHFDLRYETSFSKVGNHIYFNDEKAAFSSKIKAIGASVGYGF